MDVAAVSICWSAVVHCGLNVFYFDSECKLEEPPPLTGVVNRSNLEGSLVQRSRDGGVVEEAPIDLRVGCERFVVTAKKILSVVHRQVVERRVF